MDTHSRIQLDLLRIFMEGYIENCSVAWFLERGTQWLRVKDGRRLSAVNPPAPFEFYTICFSKMNSFEMEKERKLILHVKILAINVQLKQE